MSDIFPYYIQPVALEKARSLFIEAILKHEPPKGFESELDFLISRIRGIKGPLTHRTDRELKKFVSSCFIEFRSLLKESELLGFHPFNQGQRLPISPISIEGRSVSFKSGKNFHLLKGTGIPKFWAGDHNKAHFKTEIPFGGYQGVADVFHDFVIGKILENIGLPQRKLLQCWLLPEMYMFSHEEVDSEIEWLPELGVNIVPGFTPKSGKIITKVSTLRAYSEGILPDLPMGTKWQCAPLRLESLDFSKFKKIHHKGNPEKTLESMLRNWIRVHHNLSLLQRFIRETGYLHPYYHSGQLTLDGILCDHEPFRRRIDLDDFERKLSWFHQSLTSDMNKLMETIVSFIQLYAHKHGLNLPQRLDYGSELPQFKI